MNSAMLKTQETRVGWKKKKPASACYREVSKLKLSIFRASSQKPSDFVRQRTTKWNEVFNWLFKV